MEGGFEMDYEQDLLAEYKDLIDLDIHRWVGMVKWFDGMPFGVAGDSGALVYAMENSVKIPLGLHIGSPQRHARSTTRAKFKTAFYPFANSLQSTTASPS